VRGWFSTAGSDSRNRAPGCLAECLGMVGNHLLQGIFPTRVPSHSTELDANAVVGLRFDSGDVGEQQGMAEILAYGTAVVIE
jgi:hypothetical protein